MKFYENGEYSASKNWPYAISAGSVIYRLNNKNVEILLLKRAAGDFPYLADGNIDSYHLPKGHVGLAEKLYKAAVRETAEEAGVKVEIQTYLGHKIHDYTDHNGIAHKKTIHFFAGLWQSDLEEIDDEHSDTVWVSLDEAEKLLGKPNPKNEDEVIRRLKKFLELSGEI